MRSHRTGPVSARHCQRIRACGVPPPWPISSRFAPDSPLEGERNPNSQSLLSRASTPVGRSKKPKWNGPAPLPPLLANDYYRNPIDNHGIAAMINSEITSAPM
jgi:hypothetical protein